MSCSEGQNIEEHHTCSVTMNKCVVSLANSVIALSNLRQYIKGFVMCLVIRRRFLSFHLFLFLCKDRLSSAHKDIVVPQSEDFRVCRSVKCEGRQSSSSIWLRSFYCCQWHRYMPGGPWPLCGISKAVVLGDIGCFLPPSCFVFPDPQQCNRLGTNNQLGLVELAQ